jgi:hypothetical protein
MKLTLLSTSGFALLSISSALPHPKVQRSADTWQALRGNVSNNHSDHHTFSCLHFASRSSMLST